MKKITLIIIIIALLILAGLFRTRSSNVFNKRSPSAQKEKTESLMEKSLKYTQYSEETQKKIVKLSGRRASGEISDEEYTRLMTEITKNEFEM